MYMKIKKSSIVKNKHKNTVTLSSTNSNAASTKTQVFWQIFSIQIMILTRGVFMWGVWIWVRILFFSPCNFMMWICSCVVSCQCSSSCAGGVQRRAVVCQDENGQNAYYCDAAAKPPEAKHCDSGPCPQWNYGSWGEVSQSIF